MTDPFGSGNPVEPEHGIRITSGEAQIWSVPLESDPELIDSLQQTLSKDERDRAAKFYSTELQHSFIASRAILRAILSLYAQARPEDLHFSYAAKGKPYLQDHPSFHFNLAHSGNRAVYAIADDDIGVDIELIKPWRDLQKISARFFSPREAAELQSLHPEQQTISFFTCWTRKEAYIKATGEGMATLLAKFYAGTDPSLPHGQIEEEGRNPQWYFSDLNFGDDYAGAVVTRSPQPIFRCMNFPTVKECLHFIEGKKEVGSEPYSCG